MMAIEQQTHRGFERRSRRNVWAVSLGQLPRTHNVDNRHKIGGAEDEGSGSGIYATDEGMATVDDNQPTRVWQNINIARKRR